MNMSTIAPGQSQRAASTAHAMHAPLSRLTAITGLASVILAVVGFALLGNAPGTDASGQTMITYAAHNRVLLLALAYLFGLSFALILCFMTGLRTLFRGMGERAEALATLGLVGGIVWTTLGFGILLFALAPAFRPVQDPGLARTLADLSALMENLSGFPTAVNMGAFGAALLLTGLLPRWVAWFAVVIALVHLISAGAYAQGGVLSPSILPGLVAPLLYYVWVVVVSVILWRRAGTTGHS